MQSIKRTFVTLTALAFLLGAAHVVAAQEPPAPQEPPAAPQEQPAYGQEAATTAEGELLRVDPDAQTLAIRTADGTEKEFRYNDQTEVTGAEEGAAGLAAKTGSQVTVHFNESEQEGQAAMATKIEIQPGQ